MTLPHRNALLTRVQGSGSTDTWEAAVAGGDKWSGSVDAYYSEERERRTDGSGSDVVVTRSLVIENGRPPVEIAIGDLVFFTFRGAEVAGSVRQVERRELPIAGVTATTRLTLEDA